MQVYKRGDKQTCCNKMQAVLRNYGFRKLHAITYLSSSDKGDYVHFSGDVDELGKIGVFLLEHSAKLKMQPNERIKIYEDDPTWGVLGVLIKQ